MYLIINKFIADVPTVHNNGTLVIKLDGVAIKESEFSRNVNLVL